MQTIRIYYVDGTMDTMRGKIQVLSCGVIEVVREVEATESSFIAALTKEQTVGIPFLQVKKYEIED